VAANREDGAAEADGRGFFEGEAQRVRCQAEVARAQGRCRLRIAAQVEFGAIEVIQVSHIILVGRAIGAGISFAPAHWRSGAGPGRQATLKAERVRRLGRMHALRHTNGRAERFKAGKPTTGEPAGRSQRWLLRTPLYMGIECVDIKVAAVHDGCLQAG
jgi:hypothetical protein